jgi:hypothetical protein
VLGRYRDRTELRRTLQRRNLRCSYRRELEIRIMHASPVLGSPRRRRQRVVTRDARSRCARIMVRWGETISILKKSSDMRSREQPGSSDPETRLEVVVYGF